MEIKLEQGEVFWGLRAANGPDMPFGTEEISINLHKNSSLKNGAANGGSNQVNPMLVSSRGRWFWCEKEFDAVITPEKITITNNEAPVECGRAENLKAAFHELSDRFFRPNGKLPASVMLEKPQYNTWVELQINQNQEGILEYAHGIVDHGFPPGVLMIDDSWQENFGVFNFHPARFPDPKAMTDELHALGFKVVIWVTPFISPDSMPFRRLMKQNLLVKNKNGGPSLRGWWNGYSAMLDLTNPKAVDWLRGELDRLMKEYGADGFKFDAGHPNHLAPDAVMMRQVTGQEYNSLYVDLAAEYEINECKSCYKHAGCGIACRQGDKHHDWGTSHGIGALIPNAIAQGLMGFACNCPDMIGGGLVSSTGSELQYDEELFVRTAQASALFPMMQFSAAPWRVLSEKGVALCREAALLHEKFAPVITALAEEYSRTCAPILRCMEYEFPGCGYEKITDQFMLGSKYLVAPVLTQGAFEREAVLPEGKWRYVDGTLYEGGRAVTVPAPIEVLPYFERMD